jgi:hypothetical protein
LEDLPVGKAVKVLFSKLPCIMIAEKPPESLLRLAHLLVRQPRRIFERLLDVFTGEVRVGGGWPVRIGGVVTAWASRRRSQTRERGGAPNPTRCASLSRIAASSVRACR